MSITDNKTVNYLLSRLHEKSTYMALPLILGLYGINLSHPLLQAISAIGISISGVILIALPENNAQRRSTFIEYVFDRLKEPTSRVAISVIVGSIGIHFDNKYIHMFSQLYIALGIIGAVITAEPIPTANTITTTDVINTPTTPSS